jgi:hypothetical protein
MIPVLTPLVSSNLSAVGYDAANSQLYVQFNNGTLYRYFQVPTVVYQGLMGASSHGSYLNTYVKNAGYGYQRMA